VWDEGRGKRINCMQGFGFGRNSEGKISIGGVDKMVILIWILNK